MKWTSKDSVAKKAACVPNSTISRRNTNLLISTLLRYSMRKRKHESGATQDDRRSSFYTSFGKFGARQTGKSSGLITREELVAIQTQLAILSDGDGDRPIHIAVANENLKLVQKLCLLMVKNTISLDITNYLRQTPLHLAVMLGNIEILQLLLRFGASPLICDRNGNSVLHLAVKSNCDKEVLDTLLSDAQVRSILNSMDYEGYSALHYAVFKNNSNAIRQLQISGADIDKIDGKSGRTALIHAVLEQNESMVDLLLNCGASPQKMDYSGQSAFELALQTANTSVIALLEKWMPQNEVDKLKEPSKPTFQSSAKSTKRTKN